MNNIVDRNITFNESGICSHCVRYDNTCNIRRIKGKKAKKELDRVVSKIKNSGRNKEYDCLIGISGGVDSSYVAYLVKKLGLRPLAVHLDNGWDSDLAVSNIKNLLDELKIDLITQVLNWEEFKDLQLSFLKSSTTDGDIPTDHAIFATLWRTADKYNIKYIISGMNYATESMSVTEWSYGHSDWRYIKDVHSKFGKKKLRTYPRFTPLYLFYLTFIRRIKTISILNYVDYDKNNAVSKLKSKLNWRPYKGKHHESIYTRFYHGYYLLKKFNIDKRYAHFSDLINAGKMTREKALEEIKKPPYPRDMQKEDLEYVLKKLSISNEEYTKILISKNRTYKEFKNINKIVQLMKKTVNFLRAKNIYPK